MPPQGLSLPKLELGNLPLSFTPGSGLRTPPVEDMSTTYHPAMATAYDSNAVSAYSASMAHSAHTARSRAAMIEGAGTKYPHYAQQQPANTSQQRYNPVPVASHAPMASTQPNRPVTPTAEAAMVHDKENIPEGGPAETLIYHSLLLPRCISIHGGNLAEFAAQVCIHFTTHAHGSSIIPTQSKC